MIRFLLLCSLLLIPMSTAVAEKVGGEQGAQPIQIKSDTLTADSGKRTATFSGNVVARRGELVIYTDRLVVYYGEKGNEVSRAEAFGNVRIVHGDRRGQAGHGVYDMSAGSVMLDDNPKLFQGDDMVEGSVITYFVKEQRSTVTGGTKAIIHPREKGKDGR